MYDYIKEDILFCMFYGGVATMSLIASCYLLFRQSNAFAPDITSPVRLRRWTAAFFAAMALSHLWYLPIIYVAASDDLRIAYLIGGLLDCITVIPLSVIVLLTMLQDRRRPLWPAFALTAPIVVIIVCYMICSHDILIPMVRLYLLLYGIGYFIYIVRASRQYDRWLCDNYADLEHKEVWMSFVVVTTILLTLGFYATDLGGKAYEYIVQTSCMLLVCFLLWRTETLSDLSIQQPLPLVSEQETVATQTAEGKVLPPTSRGDISLLLQEHCIDTQLFLLHDLTLQQLAKAIGINRYYLSQYFSSQGTTYNAYINGLRINHFVNLYHKAVAAHRPFTTKQLAHNSGYRSYSTFSNAFKQRMGQTVTEWMQDAAR